MQILEAALATALVLLAFASIVTVIMEIVLRVLGIKAKGFEEIAQAMFDDVLLPRLKKELGKIKGLKGKNLGEKFKNAFENYKSVVSTKDIAPIDQGEKKLFSRLLSPKFLMRRYSKPDNISVEDFFEKLAGSEIGKALYAKAKDNLDDKIADLAKKYERLGSEVREDFIRNSAFMTQVFGILLAFALNLNVFTFFTTFMEDPELTQEIIAQTETLLKTSEASTKRLNTAGEENPNQETLDEISDNLAKIKQDLDSDFYQSLPMGYDTFKYCLNPFISCEKPKGLVWSNYLSVLPFVEGEPSPWDTTVDLFPWLVSVLLTGILIGLGGPFWYNFVMKLSGIIQTVRGRTPASKPAAPPATGQPAKSPLVEQYSTAIDAFKLAAENPSLPEKTK